jgi:hypothetical protein
MGSKHPSILTGDELRQKLRKWLNPPDPFVNYNTALDALHQGTPLGSLKATLSPIGSSPVLCCGYMEIVRSPALSPSLLPTDLHFDSGL